MAEQEPKLASEAEEAEKNKVRLSNLLENAKNVVGRIYEPSDKNYWSALKLKLQGTSEGDLEILIDLAQDSNLRNILSELLREGVLKMIKENMQGELVKRNTVYKNDPGVTEIN